MLKKDPENLELESQLTQLGINPWSNPTSILLELEKRYDEGEKTDLLTSALANLSFVINQNSDNLSSAKEPEPVNAFTYYGKNPRKNKEIYRRNKQLYKDYHRDKGEERNKYLWNSRQDVMAIDKFTPQLGDLDKLSMKMAIHTLPISEKGSILLCNSLESAAQEINTWEGVMKQAIALLALKEKKELTKDEKFSYYEMCLSGNAQLAWEALKKTPAWATVKEQWDKTEGNNTLIPDFFRLHFCGIRSNTETEMEQKKMAIDQLNKIQFCDMADLARYNETFNKLLLIIREPYKTEYLDLYFTKLPSPWDTLMKSEYQPDTFDCLGTRIAFLQQKLESLCRERQIRKAASHNIKSLCAKVKQPMLNFGCNQNISKSYRKTFKYSYEKDKLMNKTRRPKRAKPRFKQNNTKLVKKPANQVKCWGCQQVGHYANKCPNKPPIQHIRTIQLIQKAEAQGYVLKDEYLSNSETDYDFSSSSEESTSFSE